MPGVHERRQLTETHKAILAYVREHPGCAPSELHREGITAHAGQSWTLLVDLEHERRVELRKGADTPWEVYARG